MKFKIAPGVPAALTNMDDNRAYYTLDGDLNQMGLMYTELLRAGFQVVKTNVYPGFMKADKDEYIKTEMDPMDRARMRFNQATDANNAGDIDEAKRLYALAIEDNPWSAAFAWPAGESESCCTWRTGRLRTGSLGVH